MQDKMHADILEAKWAIIFWVPIILTLFAFEKMVSLMIWMVTKRERGGASTLTFRPALTASAVLILAAISYAMLRVFK